MESEAQPTCPVLIGAAAPAACIHWALCASHTRLEPNTLLVVLGVTQWETGGVAISQGPLTAPRAELALESRPWGCEAMPPSSPHYRLPLLQVGPTLFPPVTHPWGRERG